MLNGMMREHVLLVVRYFSVAEFTAINLLSLLVSCKHSLQFKNVLPSYICHSQVMVRYLQ